AGAELFESDPGHRRHQTSLNVRKLLEARELLGAPLPPSYARRLLTASKERTLDEWFAQAASIASDAERGRKLVSVLEELVADDDPPLASDAATGAPLSHTFEATASRAFEERYWNTISFLAEGRFVAKDNADFAA